MSPSLTATAPNREPTLCTSCRADEFACAVKAGLGGRTCCEKCTHVVIRMRRKDDER